MDVLIKNGRVITPDGIIENGFVLMRGGVIAEAGVGAPPQANEVCDAGGDYISPGFVDIHIHGGGGHDFMDATPQAFIGVAKTNLPYGTTTLYPTTVASPKEALFKVFDAFEKARADAEVGSVFAGLHLEGPYLNPEYKGAMDPRYVVKPDLKEFEEILEYSKHIARVTVAPELPDAMRLGRLLARRGIVASIGHTAAPPSVIAEAAKNGFTLATHLGNAMSGVKKSGAMRRAGVFESILINENINAEIIADGVHQPPEILKMAYMIKGAGRLALVTDALRVACQDISVGKLGDNETGMRIIIEEGVAKLADGSALAGSIATCDRLVRVMIAAGVPFLDAVKMATETPAKVTKNQNIGAIKSGLAANIAVFDENIKVKKVFLAGKKVYQV